MPLEIRRYEGTAAEPWPANPSQGWVPCPYDDQDARVLASSLGALPAWHFVDTMTRRGLVRTFAYDTPAGVKLGGMRFVGTLGQDPGTGDATGGGSGDPSGGDPTGPGGANPPDIPLPVIPMPPPPNLPENPPGGGGGGGGGGGSSPEPVPQPTASCTWSTISSSPTDPNDVAAAGLANSISYHNTPTTWVDGSVYSASVGGVQYAFSMWNEGGVRMVAVYRCTPVQAPPSSSSGGGVGALLLGAAAIVGGGLAIAGLRKPRT